MGKTDEVKRFEADLKANAELRKNFEKTLHQLAEEEKPENDGALMVKAASLLGYDFTVGDLERVKAEAQEMDPEELDKVAGGRDGVADDEGFCWKDYWCTLAYRTLNEDEFEHDSFCYTAWHCYAVVLHTDSESDKDKCWTDYLCMIIAY